jgi:hypothetical protein
LRFFILAVSLIGFSEVCIGVRREDDRGQEGGEEEGGGRGREGIKL